MNQPLVEAIGVKKYFKTPRGMLHAVEDVNFKIYEGKTLGVVGESGCGKYLKVKIFFNTRRKKCIKSRETCR